MIIAQRSSGFSGCSSRHPITVGCFDEQLQNGSIELHCSATVFAHNDGHGTLGGGIMFANSFVPGTAWTSPQVNTSHLMGTSDPEPDHRALHWRLKTCATLPRLKRGHHRYLTYTGCLRKPGDLSEASMYAGEQSGAARLQCAQLEAFLDHPKFCGVVCEVLFRE
jgi:hypothetical protein